MAARVAGPSRPHDNGPDLLRLARIPRDTPLRHAAYPALSDESGQPMTLVSYRLPNAPEYSEDPRRIAQWKRDVATGVGCFYVVASPLGDSR